MNDGSSYEHMDDGFDIEYKGISEHVYSVPLVLVSKIWVDDSFYACQ